MSESHTPGGAPAALRPPKAGRLWSLRPSGPWDQGLIEAFTRVIGHALHQRERAPRDPEKAVHEYRKSIRRARAVVKLAREALGERAFLPFNHTLRQAVLATSGLRDTDVLRHLAQVLAAGSPNMEEREVLLRLDQVLAARQSSHREGSVVEVLEQGAELLAPLPARFARDLPALTRAALREGFADSYRRARRARREADALGSEESIHAWRKRVKELRYQLELDPLSDEAPERLVWAQLAESLGEITDRHVLRHTVLELRGELGARGPVERLLQALDAGLFAALAAAFEGSHAAFAPRPRAFAASLLAGPLERSLAPEPLCKEPQ